MATLADRNDFCSNNNQGNVPVKVEDSSLIATTDVTTDVSLCSPFVSVLLTPSADQTCAPSRPTIDTPLWATAASTATGRDHEFPGPMVLPPFG